MKQWIDISQPLTNQIAHWPDDKPFSYQLTSSKQQNGAANIGQFTSSLHIGTHVDAPFHYKNDGNKIYDLDINVYIGQAKVINVSAHKTINRNLLEQFSLDGVERLLLRTSLPSTPNKFPDSIPVLDQDIAPFLFEKGVRLLGVNMPSVDPLDSKELLTHHALGKHNIYILENLVLDYVKEGDYLLSALPLAIVEGDGSPVRAVVQKLDN
ncbi:arylformamidase [Aquibacillus rhizosphaerae]|uniref:Kynurenine formamidase n=1 Tax=Aquibacillus rhizosphaerae TaxID=3051431 RepID=A0ABT7L1L2_9BACI|nr:arylformamidase [Aquibacillus sp. LR5S19]MDL4839739.1 arylformamidase [Aquibacillus sp. LR5S19]